jgi:HK97 family phage prohead protease
MRAVSEQDRFIRTLSARASKVDVSADEKHLTGYAIVFNSLSEDLGGWKEIIAPSAVDRTLKAGTNVDALVDHRRETSTILGSTQSGLLVQRKDRHGLYVDIYPPDTTAARDVVTNVKAGLVGGMSFAFRGHARSRDSASRSARRGRRPTGCSFEPCTT